MSDVVTRVIEAHHARLNRDRLRAFEDARTALGVAKVPTLARPLFVAAAQRPMLAHSAEVMARALRKVMRQYAATQAFARLVHLSDDKRRHFELDALRDDPVCFMRFDVIFDARTGTLKFLECNGGDPSGLGWVDRIRRGMISAGLLDAAHGAASVRGDDLYASARDVMLSRYRNAVRDRKLPLPDVPAIGYVCSRECLVWQEYECLVEDLRADGLDASLGEPRDYRWDGQRLFLDGKPRELVMRDTIDDFVLPPSAGASQAIVDAYRSGAVVVLNPFGALLTDDKSLFEVLSSPEYDPLFDAEERRVLRAHVPWTRVMVPALVAAVLERRETLVLKPVDGYGGIGVVVGRDVDRDAWRSAVDGAVQKPGAFIVQDYVPIPEELFPDGTLEARPLKVTLSLWIHDGKYVGSFARAAAQSVINVHQGGGLLPVFFVDE